MRAVLPAVARRGVGCAVRSTCDLYAAVFANAKKRRSEQIDSIMTSTRRLRPAVAGTHVPPSTAAEAPTTKQHTPQHRALSRAVARGEELWALLHFRCHAGVAHQRKTQLAREGRATKDTTCLLHSWELRVRGTVLYAL